MSISGPSGVVVVPTPTPQPYPGYFIAFEGGEGAGKSTQVRLLAERLRAAGHSVLTTREPGGAPAAEQIREVLLTPTPAGLDARTEMLLFAAARAEHVRAVVRPALDGGAIVITDRYLDSSIAYQGVARDLGRDLVEAISLWATDGLVPDLTIVLDVDEPLGRRRRGTPDRIEAESADFHHTVQRSFRGLAARSPHRYLVLDASSSISTVADGVAARVDAALGEHSMQILDRR